MFVRGGGGGGGGGNEKEPKIAEFMPCLLLHGMSQRHPLAPSNFLPPPQLEGEKLWGGGCCRGGRQLPRTGKLGEGKWWEGE